MNIVKTLDYEVVKKPVLIDFGPDDVVVSPDKVAIVNDKTRKVLSYMHPNYELFNNEEFMGLANKISETFGLKIDHYNSYKGGKKVLAAFEKTDKTYSVCGYDFTNHVVLYDSRDGSMCLGGAGVASLNRCDNMFSSTRKRALFNIRHNSSLHEKIAEFELGLALFDMEVNEKITVIEQLQDVKVTQENLYDLIGGWTQLSRQQVRDLAYGKNKDDISSRKENIVNGLINSWSIESAELGANGFGMYNAVTHYYTHKRKKGENDLLFADFGKKEQQTIEFLQNI